MKPAVRVLLCATLSLQIAGVAAGEIAANRYPARPIRLIVPQSAGGGTDLYSRLVATALAERFGQAAIVDNRPGAGSVIGTDLAAKATPDGYTLLGISSSFTIVPSMYRTIPFDPLRDFAAVALLSSYPHLVAVHPSVPASSIKELIALAKAKPGALNYASAGIGTPTQLGAELFKSMAGVNIVHVPYKGGGPAVIALLGGQCHVYFGPIATVLPHAKNAKLKALAVTSAQRSTVVPDLPTVAEAGVPGFRQDAWNGLLAPARTPAAIIAKLESEVSAVLKMPAIRERLAADGVEPGGIGSGEFAAMLKSEIAKWAKVVQHAGIKPE
jgi:tripartite-type tricarboxylate transporter receptor subunit TctC